MIDQKLRTRKAAIEAQFGPWTGKYSSRAWHSNQSATCGPHLLLRRAVQTIEAMKQLRILDFGSLEGSEDFSENS